jgi:hypothetical protein
MRAVTVSFGVFVFVVMSAASMRGSLGRRVRRYVSYLRLLVLATIALLVFVLSRVTTVAFSSLVMLILFRRT